MAKKKYEVTVDAAIVNTYWFTVEAHSEEEAEKIVLGMELWEADSCTDENKPNGYEVADIQEVE